jgi:DNA-binding beta-propeller fold protein YncE
MKNGLKGLLLLGCFLITSTLGYADTIYVVDTESNTVDEFDPSGNLSVFATAPLFHPEGAAFDSNGNLYVANPGMGPGTIEKYDPNGNGSVFASTGLGIPTGVAFYNGYLYVANLGPGGGFIERYNSAGQGSVFVSTGLDHPQELAFDANGNLYVANSVSNSIVKIDQNGNESIFASGLSDPTGLAFDASGDLYVANSSGYGNIERFTPNGVGSVFANPYGASPFGLAFNSNGNLYAANWGNGSIEKFDQNGNPSVFATGLTDPMFIAVQVPEPSSLLLTTVGLLSLWVCAKQRRR